MRVRLERSGGFANVHRTVAVDEAALAPERAEELRRLIADAGLAALPHNPERRAATPDRFVYRLTVEDERGARAVVVSEDAASEAMQRLIDWVQATTAG